MGWLIALIEIVAAAALGLFGIETQTAELCEADAATIQMVVYVESPDSTLWQPASGPRVAPNDPCPDVPAPPWSETTAKPVFLIEI